MSSTSSELAIAIQMRASHPFWDTLPLLLIIAGLLPRTFSLHCTAPMLCLRLRFVPSIHWTPLVHSRHLFPWCILAPRSLLGRIDHYAPMAPCAI